MCPVKGRPIQSDFGGSLCAARHILRRENPPGADRTDGHTPPYPVGRLHPSLPAVRMAHMGHSDRVERGFDDRTYERGHYLTVSVPEIKRDTFA